MDRLIAEPETKVETQTQVETEQTAENLPQNEQKTQENEQILPRSEEMSANSAYLNSFENLTVADIKREEERKEAEAFKQEKEQLLQQQFVESETAKEQEEVVQETKAEEKQKVSVNIIEKPNYDLIEEKKVIKIQSKKPARRASKKAVGIALACTLGAAALVCVANTIIIDQMNASYIEIDESYNFNLGRYLKNLNNLDATKKGMEFVETYPEDMNDAGDIGEKSNWFDKVCGVLGGLFGG